MGHEGFLVTIFCPVKIFFFKSGSMDEAISEGLQKLTLFCTFIDFFIFKIWYFGISLMDIISLVQFLKYKDIRCVTIK